MSYSTLTEFTELGLQGAAVDGYEAQALTALEAAQGTMHGYFRAASIDLPLPETSVDTSIKQYECWLAALPFMSARGFDPEQNPDAIIVTNHKLAMAWLKDVAAKRTIIVPIVAGVEQDGDTSTTDDGSAVASDTPRYWGYSII